MVDLLLKHQANPDALCSITDGREAHHEGREEFKFALALEVVDLSIL
jgi:hypothetical protein